MDQLKLLMDYTKFHIGVYLSLITASIAIVKLQIVDLGDWFPTFVAFTVAGAAGGIIGSSIPSYSDYQTFRRDELGPWFFKWARYGFWSWLEHFSFWLGLLWGGYILLVLKKSDSPEPSISDRNAEQGFDELLNTFFQYVGDNPEMLFVIASILWIAGVRAWNQYTLDRGDIEITSMVERLADLSQFESQQGIVNAYKYAVLSAEVYAGRNSEGKYDRDWKIDFGQNKVYEQWKELNIYDRLPTKPAGRKSTQALLDHELKYAIWHRDLSDNSVEVAIVFAGTDRRRDMWSNLHWGTRFWPFGWNQYQLARTIGSVVENEVCKEFDKDVKFVAAGHSLGGGLAQQLAYASKNIKTVYALNSTPVTGFYDVPRETREKNVKGMRVYRIHERGEILGYLRSFMKLVYPVVRKDPQIIEASVNYGTGIISDHGIENLSRSLYNVKS
ncbi:MAG: hypothetical protein GKR95_23260 [Gammaproteobacteria bacterium]|nr:hypothetical protein [Gammaproteobacteria bacterium]